MKNIIISVDPGRLNFAYAIMNKHGNLIKTGMFENTLNELKNPKEFTFELNQLKNEIKSIFKKYGKNSKIRLVFERFVPRTSLYKGNLIEITCMKIGILTSTLLEISKDSNITPYLASTWKNFFNRNDLWIKNDSLPEHILDAIFIGIYYLIQNKQISVKQAQVLTDKLKGVNFGWYLFRGQWFHGKRKPEHSRGKKNSFGN